MSPSLLEDEDSSPPGRTYLWIKWRNEVLGRKTKPQTLQRERPPSLGSFNEQRRRARGRTRDALRITRVVAGNGIEDEGTVFGAARQRPNVIQRTRERYDSMTTDTTIGRFETGDATAGSRNAN